MHRQQAFHDEDVKHEQREQVRAGPRRLKYLFKWRRRNEQESGQGESDITDGGFSAPSASPPSLPPLELDSAFDRLATDWDTEHKAGDEVNSHGSLPTLSRKAGNGTMSPRTHTPVPFIDHELLPVKDYYHRYNEYLKARTRNRRTSYQAGDHEQTPSTSPAVSRYEESLSFPENGIPDGSSSEADWHAFIKSGFELSGLEISEKHPGPQASKKRPTKSKFREHLKKEDGTDKSKLEGPVPSRSESRIRDTGGKRDRFIKWALQTRPLGRFPRKDSGTGTVDAS